MPVAGTQEDRPADRKFTMTDDTIIHTPGRPEIHVLPRDNGGVMLSQRKNRIWLSAAEVAQLITIITGNHIEDD